MHYPCYCFLFLCVFHIVSNYFFIFLELIFSFFFKIFHFTQTVHFNFFMVHSVFFSILQFFYFFLFFHFLVFLFFSFFNFFFFSYSLVYLFYSMLCLFIYLSPKLRYKHNYYSAKLPWLSFAAKLEQNETKKLQNRLIFWFKNFTDYLKSVLF